MWVFFNVPSVKDVLRSRCDPVLDSDFVSARLLCLRVCMFVRMMGCATLCLHVCMFVRMLICAGNLRVYAERGFIHEHSRTGTV